MHLIIDIERTVANYWDIWWVAVDQPSQLDFSLYHRSYALQSLQILCPQVSAMHTSQQTTISPQFHLIGRACRLFEITSSPTISSKLVCHYATTTRCLMESRPACHDELRFAIVPLCILPTTSYVLDRTYLIIPHEKSTSDILVYLPQSSRFRVYSCNLITTLSITLVVYSTGLLLLTIGFNHVYSMLCQVVTLYAHNFNLYY